MLKNFMKKYGYYLLAFSLILVIGVSVGLTDAGVLPPSQNVEDSIPSSTAPIEMTLPLEGAEVLKWYSDTELFYNSTLKQWESHRAVDLISSTSTEVKSVLEGVVTSCTYSYEDGYCITIKHDGGLVTTYCSLKNNDCVKEGSKVARGQKIGEISSSASNESSYGDHLHFQIMLNGKSVDPANYITFENK